MPALNWDIFVALPGSAEKNFELLSRGIVRQNFGRFGVFRALANQPGVEFHLKLENRSDSLGEAGRWWGWQCKWYELTAAGDLGATRRKHIKDGIRKAEIHVPGLTDWVLWTRRTLTKSDQEWFHGLSSKMTLHLWTSDEVDNLLVGQAAVLRSTYFGELVLTPEMLADCHEQAVAPVRTRWQPGVHHVSEVERGLRRMLGDAESWDELRTLAVELRTCAEAVERAPKAPPPLASVVSEVVAASKRSADILERVAAGVGTGDLDLIRDEVSACSHGVPVGVATAPRKLRAGNHRAGLYATNAVAACHDTARAIRLVEDAFSSRIVALLAPAGCGKTHLAAQLTAQTDARPHGVLLHGRDLHATHTLDNLARHISIVARPVPSMESLLAAVDAAGQRARHRIPVFIDGLNEAEDPRLWKSLLASLEATLAKYPYVLMVCTLRPEFAGDALPASTRRVQISGYGKETVEAIREHFRYYKIDAADASIPLDLLRHPLTLRLFCEVTNQARQQVVGVSAMPGSLTELFDRYLEQVGTRVVELAPRAQRFYAHDVNTAISIFANTLWESRSRSVGYAELRTLVGDAQRPWDQSLVRALEHEGVILRMPSDGADAFVPVYDMLGGHIVASALLAKQGQSAFETWIRQPSTTQLLAGDYDERHPLAGDVVSALVGQTPRRLHAKQLWQLVDEPMRTHALKLSARLEPAFLDAATVDALLGLAREGDSDLFDRLWELRGAVSHPLNAEALDRTLRSMAVWERDLRWTEWLRHNQDDFRPRSNNVLRDVQQLEQLWRAGNRRAGDRLRARWVMWTLTSTVRLLRDQATRALYWFGRGDPEGAFALTIDSLVVSDAYVSERMLAASYGIVMSLDGKDPDVEVHLRPFLERLSTALVGESASAPTQHYLARLYVRGIAAFAEKFYPSMLPDALRGQWTFASPPPVEVIAEGDSRAKEAGKTLHMDFENYTLGRLFDDRNNYDMKHKGHQAAVAHVCGVVWALGWRAAHFNTLDDAIASEGYRGGRGNRPIAERYGKKYGWIGYYTYAGLLQEKAQMRYGLHEFSDVDIDPSFPETPATDGDSSISQEWLSPGVKSHQRWLVANATAIPVGLIRREKVREHPGPWVAVHGHVSAVDRVLGRRVWAFVSALVVSNEGAPRLSKALKAGSRPWRTRDIPSDHYVFAGEIPWHPSFDSRLLAENEYYESVLVGTDAIEIEVLAHSYSWENYHSEMNRAGGTRVPSLAFSREFDLRGAAQTFDQFLPDGSRATITLSGVDHLEADILYVREDLLRRYVGERAIVWFGFGERELEPYPSRPPRWLESVRQQRKDCWSEVLTEADFRKNSKSSREKDVEVQPSNRSKRKLAARKKVPKKAVSKGSKGAAKRSRN